MEFHCLLRLLFFRLTSKCTCNRISQTLWRHRWRNQDENTFSSTSVIWSFHTWCQIETKLNVLKFSKLTKFRYSVRLFRWKGHRKWVCCSDSQGHYLHFELLICSFRVKSGRVMTISKFYLLFYPSYLTCDLEKRQGFVLSHDASVDEIWWQHVEAFVSYRENCRNFVCKETKKAGLTSWIQRNLFT